MMPALETVERETGAQPDAAIIWLHGLGADGYDFVPIVDELSLAPHTVRYVFPHAPVRPVTLNGGLPMRAWFDVRSLARGTGEDEAGIEASAAAVAELIDRERGRGIAAERVVLAGFSQGGAVALHAATRLAGSLAGIVALSTFLPLARRFEEQLDSASREVPIFMAHGAHDPVVALSWGEMSRDALRAAGFHVSWHTYPMAHAVCAEEIADLGRWLAQVLDRGQPG